MIYLAIAVLLVGCLSVMVYWTRPTYRVVTHRTGKGYLQIRIKRKAFMSFPADAGDHDKANNFRVHDPHIIIDTIYPTSDLAEEALPKVIAEAKHLCREWNDGKDSATRLQKSAERLIKS